MIIRNRHNVVVLRASPPVQDENSCKFLLAAIFVYKPVINKYSKPVISRGSRNLVGIIVSYSHPKFRPLPHGNKSIGGVGSHRASL